MDPKVPPHSLEAEQSILGGLLLEKEAWDQISDIITEKDFYRPIHQKLYAAVSDLHKGGREVDLITVSDYLRSKGEFDSIGADYLAQLVQNVIGIANITSYAKIVKDKSLLRGLISTCSQLSQKAFDQDFESVDSFIDAAEAEIMKVGENKSVSGLTSATQIVIDSMNKLEALYGTQNELTGISSGFGQLDSMTSGLHPGELIIIAARPSMGKTAFSLNIAQHAAIRQKKVVAYFSVEMGKESVMMRMLASEAKINLSEIRTGRVADAAWPKLIAAASTLGDAPLYLDDTSAISPFEIRARCRRLKKQIGLDLIMIDYLQLMRLKQKVESREREVSEISGSLKAIAKELKVPVVALAQLNRGVEGRTDKKPMLSDLRESGSIEQDADVIMMLFREGYYDRNDEGKATKAQVIIAKQRNGPTGEVDLKWEPRFGRFMDSDPEPQHPVPPPPQIGNSYGPPGGGASADRNPNQNAGKPKNFAPGANL